MTAYWTLPYWLLRRIASIHQEQVTVIKEESSEARNSTACAISSGLPKRGRFADPGCGTSEDGDFIRESACHAYLFILLS